MVFIVNTFRTIYPSYEIFRIFGLMESAISLIYTGNKSSAWGPFLESPGNFSGLQNHF